MAAWDFFMRSLILKETSTSTWMPIIWPVKLTLFVGLFLIVLQGSSEFLKLFFNNEKQVA